jgi:hypothetical protein
MMVLLGPDSLSLDVYQLHAVIDAVSDALANPNLKQSERVLLRKALENILKRPEGEDLHLGMDRPKSRMAPSAAFSDATSPRVAYIIFDPPPTGIGTAEICPCCKQKKVR